MAKKVFKTVEESIELEKYGVPAETGFEYVYNCEEVEFDTFDLQGDIEAQLAEIYERYGKYGVKIVESGDQPFDEFTSVICDAFRTDV